MNAKQRLADYIEHMIEAAQLARSYVAGLSKTEFLHDRKTQQAVILNLIMIGEAATQIVDEYGSFAAAHPEIPWSQMRGMRNRMTHGYFQINLDIVWDTIQVSIPTLEEQLRAVRPLLDKS